MIDIVIGQPAEPTLGEQWAPLFAIVAPFAALLGVWLGKRWEHRGTTRSWRRDRRLDVYSRLMEVLGEMEDQAERATTCHSDDLRLAATNRMRSVAGTLSRLQSEILLLGTDEAASEATEAIEAHLRRMEEINLACAQVVEGESIDYTDQSGALEAEAAFLVEAQRALM